MKYSAIIYDDMADGPGIRTGIFVSGCRNRCKGCFNQEAWDFNHGEEFTEKEWGIIFASMDDYHSGISLLGGDPCEPENVEGLFDFVKLFIRTFPDKTIWCYTGYLYEDLMQRDDRTKDFLSMIDVLVDGKFDIDLKDSSLPFRGSSNQRIINLTLSSIDEVVEYEL